MDGTHSGLGHPVRGLRRNRTNRFLSLRCPRIVPSRCFLSFDVLQYALRHPRSRPSKRLPLTTAAQFSSSAPCLSWYGGASAWARCSASFARFLAERNDLCGRGRIPLDVSQWLAVSTSGSNHLSNSRSYSPVRRAVLTRLMSCQSSSGIFVGTASSSKCDIVVVPAWVLP